MLNLSPSSGQGLDESLLIKQLQRGDRMAFAVLYGRYINELLSYGMGMGFHRGELKDAIHDVFFNLYAGKNKLTEIRHLKSYLFRALKNHLLNRRRSSLMNVEIEAGKSEFSINVTIVDELIEEEERAEVRGKIDKYLAGLTDRQREAIYLRFIQEFEYEEIAELLHMTPHAARKLVSRAISSIREHNTLRVLLLLLT